MAASSRPLPPPLAPGARIGVAALAGPVDPTRIETGVAALRDAGYQVVEAGNLRERRGYLAGDDAARIAGLEAMLDGEVEAIIAARGGYGVMRVLERLPWQRLRAWGGWIVGHSDLTAFHAALGSRFPRATLHGPMVQEIGSPAALQRVTAWLSGAAPRQLFRVGTPAVVRPGTARGVSAGGNLAILAALSGTPFAPDLDGSVLFLEDIGEPTYRLDRLLTQLRLSSMLAGVRAVVAGRLTRCGERGTRWRERWRELLAEAAPPGIPVVEGVGFGHRAVNRPFPLGVEVVVDTGKGSISWMPDPGGEGSR
jgi:muramoyltetrapeptide carboxypeptidase